MNRLLPRIRARATTPTGLVWTVLCALGWVAVPIAANLNSDLETANLVAAVAAFLILWLVVLSWIPDPEPPPDR